MSTLAAATALPAAAAALRILLRTPLAGAAAAGLTGRAAREALTVIASSYEYHGGFRLKTLSA